MFNLPDAASPQSQVCISHVYDMECNRLDAPRNHASRNLVAGLQSRIYYHLMIFESVLEIKLLVCFSVLTSNDSERQWLA